jgi:hypothetical protein
VIVMPISDKTRKMLWGKSGNKCAICKRELVLESTGMDVESVVGEECHIVSAQSNGPRHDLTYPVNELDNYGNLILLCRVHHKMIDDQHETYTPEILLNIKQTHEQWVAAKLAVNEEPKPLRFRRPKEKAASFLIRLNTKKEVLNLIEGSCAASYDHDELETEQEVDLVGEFLEVVQDWGDIGRELGPARRAETAFRLSQEIEKLNELGFLVFGAREVHEMTGGYSAVSSDWPVTIIRVLRKDNPETMVFPIEDKND